MISKWWNICGRYNIEWLPQVLPGNRWILPLNYKLQTQLLHHSDNTVNNKTLAAIPITVNFYATLKAALNYEIKLLYALVVPYVLNKVAGRVETIKS